MSHERPEERWGKVFGGVNPDRAVPERDDQIPIYSVMGRGLQGNGFEVRISDPDTTNETYLEGWKYDEASQTYEHVWDSENINGGELSYYYNLRPWTIPQVFTMTWVMRRPNRPQWSETTPAIPYIWDADGSGQPSVDDLVGSGLGNLWVREGTNAEWKEQLVFPSGTTAADFNSPGPLEPWSGNITFGFGGDIELPNLDDIAKILGWSRTEITNVLNDVAGALDGSDNVKDYIDDKDAILQEQITNIDERVTILEEKVEEIETNITNIITNINEMGTKYDTALTEILNKIYGGGTIDPDTGEITWGRPLEDDLIAIGNVNIYTGDNDENYILTGPAGDNDIRQR